uniref:Uncharacterized protein n=1 Tax=Panagrolaimus sp. JU765 TaxID=591449 RepID=A0AC34QDA3_9BILA
MKKISIFAVLTLYFWILIAVTDACQSTNMDVVRRTQRRHPQQCMQCSPIKISKLCEHAAINKNGNMLKCGKVSEPLYGMTYDEKKKHYCAWVIVECFSRLSKIPTVIAVDRFDLNVTTAATFNETIGNFTDIEIDTKLFIDEVQKIEKREVADFGDNFSPFIYISPEKTVLTSTKIHCNDNAEWEATANDGTKVAGFEKIHCVVGKTI